MTDSLATLSKAQPLTFQCVAFRPRIQAERQAARPGTLFTHSRKAAGRAVMSLGGDELVGPHRCDDHLVFSDSALRHKLSLPRSAEVRFKNTDQLQQSPVAPGGLSGTVTSHL